MLQNIGKNYKIFVEKEEVAPPKKERFDADKSF